MHWPSKDSFILDVCAFKDLNICKNMNIHYLKQVNNHTKIQLMYKKLAKIIRNILQDS